MGIYGAFGVMASIRDCGSLDTGSTPVLLPKKITGSRGMVLSRLHWKQEHVGLNPVFPTICSISIVVIILACHAGDEDSISSCYSRKHTASF